MEKVINISGKEFQMKASALTQFSYKNFTGRSFLEDLKSLVKLKEDDESSIPIVELDNVTELLLKIAYILIKESDKEHNTSQIIDYDSFLGSLETLYDDEKWIYEVLELACTPISRQLQINKK